MLPSVINGAQRCVSLTKRTKLLCKNPAAYGCKVCRYHGAHKSRNVLRNSDHPQYKNGKRTKEIEAEHRRVSTALLTLLDIGDSIGMFNRTHTRGRKPNNYIKYNMNDPEQLAEAIIKTFLISPE
jgi:hypothetical protein